MKPSNMQPPKNQACRGTAVPSLNPDEAKSTEGARRIFDIRTRKDTSGTITFKGNDLAAAAQVPFDAELSVVLKNEGFAEQKFPLNRRALGRVFFTEGDVCDPRQGPRQKNMAEFDTSGMNIFREISGFPKFSKLEGKEQTSTFKHSGTVNLCSNDPVNGRETECSEGTCSPAKKMKPSTGDVSEAKSAKPNLTRIDYHLQPVEWIIAYVYYNNRHMEPGTGTIDQSGGFFKLFNKDDAIPNHSLQDKELGMKDYKFNECKRVIAMIWFKSDAEGISGDGYYACSIFARIIRGVNKALINELVDYMNEALGVFAQGRATDDLADYWISQVKNRILPYDMDEPVWFSEDYHITQDLLRAIIKKIIPEGLDRDKNPIREGEIRVCKTKVPSPKKALIFEHGI